MRFGLVLVLVLLLWAAGCIEPAERELLEDEIPIAQKDGPAVLIELGSPRALPHLSESGWSHGETAEDGATFRWALGERASFRFESREAGKRIAWLECEPFLYEGAPAQWIRLALNGDDIAEIELRPGRERYPVELPLTLGENRIELRFRYAGDPNRKSPDRRRLAVRFYRFDVLPAGETPVRGKPGPFSWTDAGLYLPAGGRVRLFADVAGEARLELTRARPAPLHVVVRTRERALIDETLEGEGGFETALDAEGPIAIELSAGDRDVTVRPELFARESEAPATTVTPPAPRSIVLVLFDGANALRTGLYGYEENTTPVLDALGRQSVVYETAVSQAVYTIASVGSLLTGQYPERHQSVSFADKLGDVPTLPGLLSARGYRTAGFSGNAVASKTFGLDRGYDEFFQVWERADYTGHGDSVLESFRSWLENVGEARFFASVHFREPHFPYNPPPPFDRRFGPSEPYPGGLADRDEIDRLNHLGRLPGADVVARIEALYDGNLAYVDHLLGKLLELLDEDTVVIVTADHGEAIFEHGFLGHNTQLYEESIRVPLVVKIPGVSPRRVPHVVELLDVAPTILRLAGIEPGDMQGRSLFAASTTPRLAFSRTVWTRPRYSARGERFKLIWDSRTGNEELYDLADDPKETVNVLRRHDFVAGYLEARLYRWLREQEHSRAEALPGTAVISEDEREILRGLGYLGDGKRP